MNKKSKIQLTIIITLMILLIVFLLYEVGYYIYNYVEVKNKRNQIMAEFTEIYEKEGTHIILFASPSCKWCKKFVPILDEIVNENHLSYYYFDISSIYDSDMKSIKEKLDINFSGIPHLFVINEKKLIGEQSGAQEKDETIKFFENIGVIGGEINNGESISINS